MTTDTDALLATVRREAIHYLDGDLVTGASDVHSEGCPGCKQDAALDSLTAELERLRLKAEAREVLATKGNEWRVELERVKAERDKLERCVGLLRPEEAKNFWFQFNNHPSLAEIEGEAPKRTYPREMAEHFDGTEAQAQAYERLRRAEIEGEA